MHHQRRIIGAVLAAAILALPAVGLARTSFLAQGRTQAIRTGIAIKLNALNKMHVGNSVRPQDIRIKTTLVQEQRIGAQQRAVDWRHKTGIVAGTTTAFTPIVPNGGKYTTVKDLQLTLLPRALVAPAGVR